MRQKTQQSTEDRRAAIAKEIEAITVDIERVRSLVIPEPASVSADAPHQTQHIRVPAPSRSASGIS